MTGRSLTDTPRYRPVLVNVSSLKIIITFFIASNVTTWVSQLGSLRLFAIFAESLVVVSLGIPVFYFTGKRLRQWTGGKVHKTNSNLKRVATGGSGPATDDKA